MNVIHQIVSHPSNHVTPLPPTTRRDVCSLFFFIYFFFELARWRYIFFPHSKKRSRSHLLLFLRLLLGLSDSISLLPHRKKRSRSRERRSSRRSRSRERGGDRHERRSHRDRDRDRCVNGGGLLRYLGVVLALMAVDFSGGTREGFGVDGVLRRGLSCLLFFFLCRCWCW